MVETNPQWPPSPHPCSNTLPSTPTSKVGKSPGGYAITLSSPSMCLSRARNESRSCAMAM